MNVFEKDLPDELQGGRARASAPKVSSEIRDALLEKLGTTIGELRDEAVQARKESGIEAIWQACEEAYLGIDDTNRADSGGKWTKPTSLQGPVTVANSRQDDAKSTAFVLLTARYVDMAAAKICEIALPIDDKAFSLSSTPVPELVAMQDNAEVLNHPQTGQPIMAPPQPGQPGQPPQPQQPPKQLTKGDLATAAANEAKDCAEKAEKRIWDWMTEGNFPSEMRILLHDGARIGVGVLKGPFPTMKMSKSMQRIDGGLKMTIQQNRSLATKWIDPWNFFPDGACGEDIHSGDYIFERDHLASRKLKRLKNERDSLGKPIYLASQIDKVLEEGPNKCNVTESGNPNQKVNKKRFEVWYFTGSIKRSDMALADAVGIDELPEDIDEVFAVVTLVNDTVIRATVNPLESGEFAYHAMPWTRRAGSWAGVGVGEKVGLAQRMVNAGTRSLLNNAGVTSGSQIIIDPVGLVAADKNNRITPLKVWHKTPDSTVDDVRKLFAAIDIPNQGPQLMAIIQYGMKLAEEASGIPLIAQGQQGSAGPETFGQAELENNNANALLRSLGLRIDDHITTGVVEQHYEMLLLDPDVPEDEKGDWTIVANGTTAMVEKAIQEKTMLQAAGLTQNPAYGIDPKKWFAEYWKTKRLDPRKIQFTEEEQAQQAQNPPPEPIPVTVAKINAQASTEKSKMDTDRDTVYAKTEAERAQTTATAAQDRLMLEREIANLNYQIKLMEFASNERISLEAAKVKLAETAQKLNVQKELSADALSIGLHKHHNPAPVMTPPTEPAGRAVNGQAFAE
jgi:hypothetical protein